MRTKVAAVLGGAALVAGGLVAGNTIGDVTPEESVTFVGPGTSDLQPGQYVGPCSIVTPPDADPCQAAQSVLRYQFWGAMVNAAWFNKWKKSAPGDFSRLKMLLAAPVCSTFTNPQPQTMVTRFGEALGNEIEAYACALGTEAIVLPAADPAPTGTDKVAPGAPQDLQTVPAGPSG